MRNARSPIFIAQRRPPLSPEARVPFSASGALSLSLLFLLLAAPPARAARDPFWPLGYEPPKPEPVVAEQVEPVKPQRPETPPKPLPPPVKPITEQDWAQARNTITVSGFTQSLLPGTGETRTLAMINRRSYTAGDSLCLTNAGIRFLWRIDSVADRNLRLTPVKAERIAAPRGVPAVPPKTP